VFAEEKFQPMEVFRIFLNKLETEKVAFKGSPLKGVQVLGFLESRSLNFETVIVMDMNEGVMPRIRMNEPLIPREVMLALGLSQIEKEEEIQRYHFMRLIAHAKRSYLVYEDNGVKERAVSPKRYYGKGRKRPANWAVPWSLTGGSL
jgi:inactivated superfamily I helicase